MSAEDLKAIMSARSRHTDLVSAAEAQAAEKYFDDLEKKENVEQKMLEIWEVPTTVVACSKVNHFLHSCLSLLEVLSCFSSYDIGILPILICYNEK